MKKNFRLTKTTDYKRVRRCGKSYAHPLLVLMVAPNERGKTIFSISAGRNVGNAVQRNKVKRMVREALRSILGQIQPGWDVLVMARSSITQASFFEIQVALRNLFIRACLFMSNNGN